MRHSCGACRRRDPSGPKALAILVRAQQVPTPRADDSNSNTSVRIDALTLVAELSSQLLAKPRAGHRDTRGLEETWRAYRARASSVSPLSGRHRNSRSNLSHENPPGDTVRTCKSGRPRVNGPRLLAIITRRRYSDSLVVRSPEKQAEISHQERRFGIRSPRRSASNGRSGANPDQQILVTALASYLTSGSESG